MVPEQPAVHLAEAPPTKPPRWPFLLVMTLLLVTMLAVAESLTAQPRFCASCHQITPYYRAWRHSTHKKVSCLGCHQGPGPAGYVAAPLRALSHLSIQSWYYSRFRPMQAQPIDNRVCITCHSNIKDKLIRGIFKMSHKGIDTAGFACTSCHMAVGHKLPNRATAPMLSKEKCLACHNERLASARCPVCHAKDIGWRPNQLEDYAVKEIPESACSTCHPAVDCYLCHKQEPS